MSKRFKKNYIGRDGNKVHRPASALWIRETTRDSNATNDSLFITTIEWI